MKRTQLLLLSLVFLAGGSSVAFAAAAKPPPVKPPAAGKASATAVPADSYGVYTMDQANAEAAKKKKPVTYIITDQRPDEPAVVQGTNKAYWMLRDDSIVVVLRNSTAAEWPKRLPEQAVKYLKAAELGKEYPRLVVMNDDSTVAIAGMVAGKIIELDEKALDKFGKEIKKLNATKEPSADFPPPNPDAAKPAAPATPPGTTVKPAEKPGAPPGTPAKPGVDAPPAPAPAPVPAGPVTIKNAQPESWTNSEGKTIQAVLLEVDGESITFEMGGQKVPYDISKLSEASKKRVAELKAASLK